MANEKKTFEEKLGRLSEIAKQLENSDIELSKSIDLYKEGIDLSKDLKKDLEDASKLIVSKEN